MALRHPPENNVPPVARGGKRSQRLASTPRIVRYVEPDERFSRRWSRRILRPAVILPLLALFTVVICVFGYYWILFSKRIDRLLSGEIFTRSAGIYAAPVELRVGENISEEDLVNYLRRIGYVEKEQQADSARGRYSVSGASLEVEPSHDSIVDGARAFPHLRVQFSRAGRSISAIANIDNNGRLDRTDLEPELISAVTGRERAKRRIIGFNDLPANLVKAITVTEDRTFFEHYGVNVRAILRALVRRYEGDPASPIARQGGSTITQQLVKNLWLTPERSLRRKLAEAYMSVILETRLSKQQIFSLYCNQIYLGQQSGFSINGFGEASSAYFNKDVTTVNLPEAAFLAGLIRSPNRYNPYHDIDTATARRNQVLQSMLETGAITEPEASEAQAVPLKVVSNRGRIDASSAPYFSDYVQEQLDKIISNQNAAQHLRIYTTVDMDLQRAAYSAITKQLSALDKLFVRRHIEPGTLQAALVAMNAKTGEIIAMVGGRDYSKSQLNRASEAMRQPGSVFKPFVYATALNTAYDATPRVITAATTFMDAPKTFNFGNQEYSPGNFGESYSNSLVTLRDALVHSLNVVTVDVAMEVSIGRVMTLAAKAGLPKVPKAYPAMALGASEATPLQIASAYTAFAAGGKRSTPVAIRRVTTGEGVTVATQSGQKNDVLRPDVAYLMTSFLKDVVNRGTAAKLGGRGFKNVPGKTGIAGKTGTSRDGWFAGYTPNIVCAVWVGFDDGSQLGLTGADSALPIWADFMTAALAKHPDWGGDWQMPDGIQQADIDPKTGELASADDPNRRTELFINGTAPTAPKEEMPLETASPGANALPDGQDNAPPDALPAPDASQAPSPRLKPGPKSDGHTLQEGGDGAHLEGTITLDIDPTTGFIAVPSCPVIRSKTFVIGQEPKQYCGPQYHTGKSAPSATRPRLASP